MADIEFDTKEFDERIKEYELRFVKATKAGMVDVANEILRLSEPQVPFKKGLLKTSGDYEPTNDGVIVGYNKVYAARLHEHPEYRFNYGKKGKYLEDPIKDNLSVLLEVMGERIDGAI